MDAPTFRYQIARNCISCLQKWLIFSNIFHTLVSEHKNDNTNSQKSYSHTHAVILMQTIIYKKCIYTTSKKSFPTQILSTFREKKVYVDSMSLSCTIGDFLKEDWAQKIWVGKDFLRQCICTYFEVWTAMVVRDTSNKVWLFLIFLLHKKFDTVLWICLYYDLFERLLQPFIIKFKRPPLEA